MDKPKVICLCGSTRFTDVMLVIQWEFSKQGNIVLGWNALPDSYFDGEERTNVAEQEGVKEVLDELHKRKIDLADEVFVINVDGYVGESTRSEIDYAIEYNKPIYWLEAQDDRDAAREQVRAIEAVLRRVVPQPYYCEDCGYFAGADEDECCTACGAQLEIVGFEAAIAAVKEAQDV